jgi:restriction system protein
MSRASRLATSTTKTDALADRKAFVTLRFAGDELDPREISAILQVKPTRAHRKDEEFFAGSNAGNLRGRTGIWFLATDKLVESDDLDDHLRFVRDLLYSAPNDKGRITKLRDVLERAHSRAHITCFRHGDPGEAAPEIPPQFKLAVAPLGADIETDFGVYPMTSVPTYDELMWPTLRALKAMGGSATNEELLNKVIEIEQIPPDVQAIPHTDNRETRLGYNLAWAKTCLKKVGAITNSSRAVWSITKEGENLTEADVRKIPALVTRQYAEQRRVRANAISSAGLDAAASEQEIGDGDTYWKDELLQVLRTLNPAAFERLAQRLLREAGFIKVEVTGRSGDGGIDGIGVLRVNLLSFQVLFQCKRYQSSVGAGAIRDFRGAMVGRSDKGLMITTGTFTPDAKREAARDGAPAIDLIDGDQLCDLLKELKLGVKTEMVEQMTVEQGWFQDL